MRLALSKTSAVITAVTTWIAPNRVKCIVLVFVNGAGKVRIQLIAPLGGALTGKGIPRIEPVVAKREIERPVVFRRPGSRDDFDPAFPRPRKLGRIRIVVEPYFLDLGKRDVLGTRHSVHDDSSASGSGRRRTQQLRERFNHFAVHDRQVFELPGSEANIVYVLTNLRAHLSFRIFHFERLFDIRNCQHDSQGAQRTRSHIQTNLLRCKARVTVAPGTRPSLVSNTVPETTASGGSGWAIAAAPASRSAATKLRAQDC